MASKKKKIDNTKWQVVKLSTSMNGGDVSRSNVSLPTTRERALEIYKYKTTKEARSHVAYTMVAVEDN